MSQHIQTTPDLTKTKIAIAKNCSGLSDKSTGVFDVEIVKSEESRTRGLGGRVAKLSKNEGMLFVFDRPEKVSFWMKDTFIPLQIAYFDSEGRMMKTIDMKVEKNPHKPKKTYPADGPTSCALEVAPKTFSNKLIRSGALLCIAEPAIGKPAANVVK